MSRTGSNSHTRSQSRRRPSTSSRSSEVGSEDPRPSCGCRWSTGNQSCVTWILERSHRLHKFRKRARKKNGRTTRRVRQTQNTGRRPQPKACVRQKSTTQRVLYPETRHAAHEKVGTKKKGAHNPKGASNPEHGAARTTKGVRTAREHDRKGASPRNPTRRTRTSGR